MSRLSRGPEAVEGRFSALQRALRQAQGYGLIVLGGLSLTGCISAGIGAARYAAHESDPAVQVERAERDFAMLAQHEGQWTAFRATAAADALMFVPQPVSAQTWLAGREDPPRSVAWQPHAVYVSCDGDTAATTGAAQWPGGSHGMFTTIWQRQADGGWKWIADHGAPVTTPRVAPAKVTYRRARCAANAALDRPAALVRDAADAVGGGVSEDGSLHWHYVVRPNGALRFVVDLEEPGGFDRVIDDGAGGA